MDNIRIGLTKGQCELLEPIFRTVKVMFMEDAPGGIFAQIWGLWSGGAYMDVRLLGNSECEALRNITGGTKEPDGKPREVTFWEPVD